MPGTIGRSSTFTWNSVAITGVREKGVTVNGEPIDETSGENSGWRTLLTAAGEYTVDITLSGVVKSSTFLTDIFAGNLQRTVALVRAQGSTIAGTFQVVNYQETMPYKDATTYEVQLQSSGTVTFS
jgi:predicted secreted protein